MCRCLQETIREIENERVLKKGGNQLFCYQIAGIQSDSMVWACKKNARLWMANKTNTMVFKKEDKQQ